MHEETSINVKHSKLFSITQQHFDAQKMVLYFFIVEQWSGTPCANEEQRVLWTPEHALFAEKFPPINSRIIYDLYKNRGSIVLISPV
ncbi:hypothetical protein [Candidatus Steffania adelgidicola]|uniref:hypothetical protein n=1 Tax=Candidatus Steffania adelgidicola TaxID=1076626 RepID=UPI001D0020FE